MQVHQQVYDNREKIRQWEESRQWEEFHALFTPPKGEWDALMLCLGTLHWMVGRPKDLALMLCLPGGC